VLAVERLSAEAGVEPGRIGQQGRIVLGVEVGAEVGIVCARSLRIQLEEAAATGVVLACSQVVEARVGVEVLAGEANRVGRGRSGVRAGGGEVLAVGRVAIGGDLVSA
jgi:hypothetical protein